MDAIFGKKIGQYLLLEKLGEGGMAAVYNAFDTRQERNVALKLILPSRQTSQVFLERFAIEARALAQLSHVNIVRVLDYGNTDGVPFLVMEYISGGTLKEIMGNPIPWAQAAAILAPIARSLEYVHKQKIIHRDVKPSNILLDEDDTPLLSDFGVVKLLETDESPDLIATGVGIGTPDYMSPEQGMGREVDSRADIYALGVVFYEMITGQKPFTADTPMAVVIQHVTEEFPHPKSSLPKLPQFVDDVVMKAIAKDPNHRFQWMGDFAEALEQLALGERVNVHRLGQIINRNRISVVELSEEIYSADLPNSQRNSEKEAARSRQKPQWARPVLARVIMVTLVILCISAGILYAFREPLSMLLTGIPTAPEIASSELSSSTARPTKTPSSSVTESGVATILPTKSPTTLPTKPPTPTTTPKPSVTPKATLQPPMAMDSPLLLNRAKETGHLSKIALFGIGGINSIAWSEDSTTIILGTTDGIFAVDPETLMRLWMIDTQDWVSMVRIQPSEVIMAGMKSGKVSTWDFSGHEITQFNNDITTPSRGAVSAIATTPNNHLLAIGWQRGGLSIFENQSGKMTNLFQKTWEQRVITGLAFSTDASYLYVSSDNTLLEKWDLDSQKALGAQDVGIRFNSILPIGNNLLLYGTGLSAVIYGPREGRVLYYFNNVGSNITAATISPDQKSISFGLANGRIKIYDSPTPEDPQTGNKERLSLNGHIDPITALSFSPDGKTLASASIQRSLVLWDTNGTELKALESGHAAVQRVSISPNGSQMAVQFGDNSVVLYDITGKVIKSFEGTLPEGSIFSESNKYMMIAKPPTTDLPQGTLLIVDLPSGEEVQTLLGYDHGWTTGFSKDEKLLASGYPLAAFIWDTSTWNKVETHRTVDSGCGIFSTVDGTHLATFWNHSVIFSNTSGKRWCSQPPEFASPLYLFKDQSNAIYQMRTGEIWIWSFAERIMQDLALKSQKWSYLKAPHTLMAVAPDDSAFLWNRSNQDIVLSTMSSDRSTHDQMSEIIIENIDDFDYVGAIAPDGKVIALGSKFGTVSLWMVSD